MNRIRLGLIQLPANKSTNNSNSSNLVKFLVVGNRTSPKISLQLYLYTNILTNMANSIGKLHDNKKLVND